MKFAIVIGVSQGPMVVRCTSIEMLLDRLREKLHESENVIHEVGLWALRARPGDWLDWEYGWIFACSDVEPFIVRDENAWKSKH